MSACDTPHVVLRSRFARASLALLACCLLFCGCASAQTDGDRAERRIKAAFVVRFLDYVEWPAAQFPMADTPYTITVAGDPAMVTDLLELISERTVNGRRVRVQAETAGQVPPDTDVLFVGKDARPYAEWSTATRELPMLVVTDTPVGGAQDTTIHFLVVDGHVRFEVNLRDAARRRIRLGAALLSVALNARRDSQ